MTRITRAARNILEQSLRKCSKNVKNNLHNKNCMFCEKNCLFWVRVVSYLFSSIPPSSFSSSSCIMPHQTGQDLKENGNRLFKSGKYENAIETYTSALDLALGDRNLLHAILSNRAACYLKINKYQDCIDDCSAALEINGSQPKPYYRRALAHEEMGDLQSAYKDLSKLLHIDTQNADGIKAMRRVKSALEKIQSQDSEVNRILTSISAGKKVEEGLRALIGLCVDDASHSMELVRKGGLGIVGQIIDRGLSGANSEPAALSLASLGLRVLGAASSHERFVTAGISLGANSDDAPPGAVTSPVSLSMVVLGEEGGPTRISWESICALLAHPDGQVSQAASSLAMRCLRAWPSGVLQEAPPPEEDSPAAPRVEELSDEPAPPPPPRPAPPLKEYGLFLRKSSAALVLRGWLRAICNEDLEASSLAADSLCAFFSETEGFAGHEKVLDTRMEGKAPTDILLWGYGGGVGGFMSVMIP